MLLDVHEDLPCNATLQGSAHLLWCAQPCSHQLNWRVLHAHVASRHKLRVPMYTSANKEFLHYLTLVMLVTHLAGQHVRSNAMQT